MKKNAGRKLLFLSCCFCIRRQDMNEYDDCLECLVNSISSNNYTKVCLK